MGQGESSHGYIVRFNLESKPGLTKASDALAWHNFTKLTGHHAKAYLRINKDSYVTYEITSGMQNSADGSVRILRESRHWISKAPDGNADGTTTLQLVKVVGRGSIESVRSHGTQGALNHGASPWLRH